MTDEEFYDIAAATRRLYKALERGGIHVGFAIQITPQAFESLRRTAVAVSHMELSFTGGRDTLVGIPVIVKENWK